MLPTVVQLTHLDVYRDGGSLSMSFKSTDSAIDYTLLFPIDRSPAFDPALKCPTFKPPVLEIYRAGQYVSPVTGISTPNMTKETTSTGWVDACGLLEAVRPHLPGFQSEYLWVFEAMVSAAMSEGNPC